MRGQTEEVAVAASIREEHDHKDLWRSDALYMEANGLECYRFTLGRNNIDSRQHLRGKAVLHVLAESDSYLSYYHS